MDSEFGIGSLIEEEFGTAKKQVRHCLSLFAYYEEGNGLRLIIEICRLFWRE